MTQKRKIIVHIATSADGYIARADGSLDWLTSRPAPKGFYGMPEFTRSVDAKLLGRKTFDLSVEMGAPFSAHDRHYVFSRQPPPASVPAGVEFVSQPIGAFAARLRDQPGKNIWMMGGGGLIASFLDEDAIDEFKDVSKWLRSWSKKRERKAPRADPAGHPGVRREPPRPAT